MGNPAGLRTLSEWPRVIGWLRTRGARERYVAGVDTKKAETTMATTTGTKSGRGAARFAWWDWWQERKARFVRVDAHHLAVGEHIRPTDLEHTIRRGLNGEYVNEIAQYVADGDRLTTRVDPLGRHHDGQVLDDQVLKRAQALLPSPCWWRAWPHVAHCSMTVGALSCARSDFGLWTEWQVTHDRLRAS